MGRSKKRRVPVTDPAHKSTPTSLTTRSTIRKFHVLLKRRAQLEARPRTLEISRELEEIDQEMDSLGGLQQYQEMSVVGQSKERGGGSHKVLISWLRELHSPKGKENKGGLK
jgi:25S rRNA (adenine2142-N1)-methyltransferase